MAISIDTQEDLVRLIVVMFDAAVGDTYLVDLVHAAESGNSIRQIAENLFTTDQAKALYPESQSDAQFTEQFLQQLCGDYLEAAEYQMAFTDIMNLLDTGSSKGDVIVDAMNYLRNGAPKTSTFDSLKSMQANKFEVAKYHTIDLNVGATDVTELQSVLADVDHTEESVKKAKNAIDNSVTLEIQQTDEPSEIFAFTSGTEKIPDESAGIIDDHEILLVGTMTDANFANTSGVVDFA